MSRTDRPSKVRGGQLKGLSSTNSIDETDAGGIKDVLQEAASDENLSSIRSKSSNGARRAGDKGLLVDLEQRLEHRLASVVAASNGGNPLDEPDEEHEESNTPPPVPMAAQNDTGALPTFKVTEAAAPTSIGIEKPEVDPPITEALSWADMAIPPGKNIPVRNAAPSQPVPVAPVPSPTVPDPAPTAAESIKAALNSVQSGALADQAVPEPVLPVHGSARTAPESAPAAPVQFGLAPETFVPSSPDPFAAAAASEIQSAAETFASTSDPISQPAITDPALLPDTPVTPYLPDPAPVYAGGSDLDPNSDQTPEPQSSFPVAQEFDYDPPPLSTHLKREETRSDGRRSLVIAGFLGGLSLAFIGAWGYSYSRVEDGSIAGGQDSASTFSKPSAKLDLRVADIRAGLGKPVTFGIAIGGATPDRGVFLKLEGLPESSRLSTGSPLGNGDWLIPSGDVEGLKIMLSEALKSAVAVTAKLLEKDATTEAGNYASFSIVPVKVEPPVKVVVPGNISANAAVPVPKLAERESYLPGAIGGDEVPADDEYEAFGVLPEDIAVAGQAAGVRADVQLAARTGPIIPPARARPEAQKRELPGLIYQGPPARERTRAPANARVAALPGGGMRPMTDQERAIIQKGNQLMRAGDIRQAREQYVRAQAANVPEAFLALGRSYDPYYLKRISNSIDEADSPQALELYRQALSGGLVSAQVKIDRLLKSMPAQ